MQGVKHPLSGATYDLVESGDIEVCKDDRRGRFTKYGVWLSGEIRHADPHVCLWVSEKAGVSRHAQAANSLEATEDQA